MNNEVKMEQNNKLIPELRFPEFMYDGEWYNNILGKISNKITTGKLDANAMSENGKYRFYTCAKNYYKINEYAFDTEALLIAGNGAYLGYIHHYKGKFNAYQRTYVLSDFSKDVVYLKYYLEKNLPARIASEKKEGNTPYIVLSTIYEMTILFPKTEKEQQKIADCLTSLDKLISAHNDKLEALKNHKKGLLQNLFPKEGQKVPHYRFPEFVNDGEWEEKKLEGLAKIGSGHTPNKQMSNYYDGGIKWVSLADSNKLDNGYIYETKIQISKEGVDNSSAVLHPAGTVILSRDAGVGKSAVLYSQMAVSQHFIVWTCDNKSKLYNWYLYYVLQILKPVFESIAVGSTIKTIGLPYFKDLVIKVPSVKEQQKIAECLMTVDNLITAQTEKIEQLKMHKKGLMQGLFPKID